MQYREFPPHPALRPYVDCLWMAQVTADARPGHRHRVLPDNGVDILWQDSGAAPFAVGMMTAPVWVVSPQPVRTVAVRFRPGAAGLFLDTPLDTLTDRRADLADLWSSSESGRLADELWAPGMTNASRLQLIENTLLARMARLSHPASMLALRAVAAIETARGVARVETIATALGVSRQHLALQFRQQVGISPKLFARIARFRQASSALRGGAVDLARLAQDCGYFDHSHLIRDFHDFAGATPDAWRR